MVENCSFRLGLDLSTHQYCGSCATALAIYINLCYPKLFNDASAGPGLQELAGIHDVAVRNGFIRKVFSILTVQLFITTVIAGG